MSELFHKLGVDWRLLIAQLVNFLVLFFVLRRFLYKPVLDLLERRRQRISEGLRDAERSKERLQGIERERTQILHQAASERQRVLEGASGEVEELRRQRLQAAAAEAAAVIERAKGEAERVRSEILAEVRREAGDLVLAISRKATAESLGDTQHEQLVKIAIEELKKATW